MSPAAHSIIRRLDGARQKWWLFTLLTTMVLTGCVSLGTGLLFMLSDALLQFKQWMLAAMLVLWLGITVTLVVMLVRRLMRSQRSLDATARCVEAEFPELGSDLINVVQLSGDTKNENRMFCDVAVAEAAARASVVRFEDAADRETRWRRFRYCMQTPRDLGESIACLLTLIAAAVVCQLMMPNFGSAYNRITQPWKFVPTQGQVRIINVTPGNTEIMGGAALDIAAEIRAPEKKAYPATVYVTSEGEKNEEAMSMTVDKTFTKYTLSLPTVSKAFRYRLEIGDTQSDVFHVGLREKPAIEKIQVTYHLPRYLGSTAETFEQKQGDLEAAQYSEAELKVYPQAPISKGYVELGQQKYTGRVEQNGAYLVVRFPLLNDGAYTIHLANDRGHTDPNPRVNRIHVIPDRPPTVELLKPGRQESAAPGAGVPVMVRAGDDHGISRVKLEIRVRKSEKADTAKPDADAPDEKASAQPVTELPIRTVQEWDRFESPKSPVMSYRLELPKELKDGDEILLRARAFDTRDIADWGQDLKAQECLGPWHTIRVVSAEAKAQEAVEKLDSIRGSLWKIVEQQLVARKRAERILQDKDPAAATAASGQVRTEQVKVQTMSQDLVKTIGETKNEDRARIKRVLNQLAFNEMLKAVQQAEEVAKIKDLAGYAQPVPALNVTQDKILDSLRKLLDAAGQATGEALKEMQKRAGGDLPDDVKKKFEEAKAKLDKFLEQQKKVIEASENLAKKPTEDFSEKEEQLLKQLAAQEDDLSKFMKELQTDLSKLPEQDFANASLAKELVEIQTEIKMAEDALLKKSADIAVPLEQLGYERAEAMATNMEKWLPDTPDREKWSQEESLSDKDKEAPMPELPGELEDLIGDLMEQEEDVMDEAEDVTSSAIDSPDKGVGWDAADGPISSNSAKGVTGNRLPNTNEIGGRSGEGRSAKSSGEFVGDEAVGKGGRKTPSRLTPDPIMKGQIKDHSKDPQGGASGGGKESGEGGEGLEGPGPRDPGKRDHNRLAGKQAALRNKAEGVDLQQFKVSGYHHQDLEKMIDLMKQIELDLKAGRYENVLRQRKVLAQGLGNVKQYLKGEFEVRKDASVNLPTDIQKEILGSMQDPSPPGWEEFNRQYFESLGGAAMESPAAAPAAPEAKK